MRDKIKFLNFFFLFRFYKIQIGENICRITIKNIIDLPAPFLSFSSSAIKRGSLNRRRWFGDEVWMAVVATAAASIAVLPNNPNTISRRNDIVSQHWHIIDIIWLMFCYCALPFLVMVFCSFRPIDDSFFKTNTYYLYSRAYVRYFYLTAYINRVHSFRFISLSLFAAILFVFFFC